MALKPAIAVLDACVLYPFHLRNVLVQMAPDLVVGSLANARHNLSKTRCSAADFVQILKNQKLTKLVTKIRKRLTDL